MTAPRSIRPGVTYFITRRCAQRTFLLRPSAATNAIFMYCLAYAAQQTGVEIHAFVQMSNHWHGVVTDVEGRLPAFLQRMHRLIARATNTLLGRVENLWASGRTSCLPLDHADDILDKIAYTIVNPVAAGLVADPSEWPGSISTGLGQVFVAARPWPFFRANGEMPGAVRLKCTLPPMFRDLGATTSDERLRRIVRERVQREVRARQSIGSTFLGPAPVSATSPFQSASTAETRRQRRPTVASLDRSRRLAAAARMRSFRAAYRVAFDRWRAGDRATAFPDGTYLMRVLHAVSCEPPSVEAR